MRKILMLVSALTLMAVSCTKPDAPSGEDTPPVDNTGGNEDNNDNNEEQTPKVYKAGDFYKVGITEGVVIWADEAGEHGLVISLDEGVAAWSTESRMLTNQGGEFSLSNGQANSKYVKQQENWKELYPAFAWCDSKNALGLSSWYLPAPEELERALPAVEAINKTLKEQGATELSLEGKYWTSYEAGAALAYPFSFRSGPLYEDIYDLDKNLEHLVRAMRKF